MKRIFISVLVCVAFGMAAFAQAPAAMPTADQLIDKMIQAQGGKAAFEKVNTRTAKGTFEIPAMGASGPIQIFGKAPNKNLVVIDIPGYGTVTQCFDGAGAWADDPSSGFRQLSGSELAEAKRDAEFYAELKFKELYPKRTVVGKAKVGDRDTFVVEATPPDGTPQKWYFDAQTGLVARMDVEAETPQGKIPFEVYLEDYKVVDGIKMPFTIRRNSAAISFTIKLEEVKHNVPIDDAKFQKPAVK
jgi:hypothetical protein